MPVTEIEQMLRQSMGLDATSLGPRAVEQAIGRRLEKCRLRGSTEYLQLIRSNPEELQALIEAIVVAETWFFRHVEAFDALTEWLRSEWLPSHSNDVLRVLSLPCATGEEPYSIAMALFDA